VDLGAHGVGGEVLFPQTRRQFGDAAGGMLADALQNVDEVGVRMMPCSRQVTINSE
jgi:hypothetical protein